MESIEKGKSFEPSLGFFVTTFILMMLISLDGLIEAERAMFRNRFPGITDPSFTKFFIPELWVSGLLIGLMLWVAARRGKMERSLAGVLLMLLGFAISSAYEMLGKFALGH